MSFKTETQGITTVGFVTADRPTLLLRAVESLAGHLQHFPASVSLVVMDDSQAPQTRQKCRDVLASSKAHRAFGISYAGYDEKMRFAAALQEESGVARDCIEFALFDPPQCGRRVGANRNALTLQATGELALSLDDDMLCDPYAVEPEQPEIVLSPSPNPTDLRIFPDRPSAEQAMHRLDKDILRSAGELLGKTVGKRQPVEESSLEVRNAAPSMDPASMGGRSKILLSWIGLTGRSGYRSPTYLLTPSPGMRERFLRDEATYEVAKTSREIFRAAPRARTIAPGRFCQTTAIGIDLRECLPPFMPVLRGQDVIFAAVLRLCHPEYLTAYLPWAIRHDAPDSPQYDADSLFTSAARVSFGAAVPWLLRGANLSACFSPEERLRVLGTFLASWADRPLKDFGSALQPVMQAFASVQIRQLDHVLAQHHCQPEYWACDVARYREILKHSARTLAYAIPGDLPGDESGLALYRQILLSYGKLLAAWAPLVEAARRLRLKGTRLAQPLTTAKEPAGE